MTHLTRHSKKCLEKHHWGKEPRQTQLAVNPDGLVSSWSYDPAVARESLARFIISIDLPIKIGALPIRFVKRAFTNANRQISRSNKLG